MSVHVFYGYAKRESEPDDACIFCDKRESVMAYTYFGGPVCGTLGWESVVGELPEERPTGRKGKIRR